MIVTDRNVLLGLCRGVLLAFVLMGAAGLPSASTPASWRADSASAVQSRAAWLWHPEVWRTRRAEVLDMAERIRIGTLFVGLDISGGKVVEPDALRRFVASAHRRGISVLAVEGDPVMVNPKGRQAAVARVQAIRAYQAAVPATASTLMSCSMRRTG